MLAQGTTDAALTRWADGIRADKPFARNLYESAFRTFLAGQLMVRTIEVPEALPASRSRIARRDDGDTFLQLPFEAAIADFQARGLISEAEFAALQDKFRAGGFIASRLAGDALKERARAAIEANLTSGATLAETIAAIRAAELDLGITPESHGYLDTVVRTNVATAYGAGRYQAMTSAAVLAARPFWQYYTARDSRVRESHRALDGVIVEADSADAQRICPPNGYRCRCAWSTLSAADVESRGLVVTRDGVDFQPDDGFGGVPEPLSD